LQKNHIEASKLMTAYVDSLEDSSGYQGLASTCTLALAEVLMHCGKWDKSLEAFEIALPVQQEVGDQHYLWLDCADPIV
jgi:hypothetical protein